MLVRIRMNQENILYHLKRSRLENAASDEHGRHDGERGR